MASPLYYWTFHPPPGLTDIRQLPHKFQAATVDRMSAIAESISNEAVGSIKEEWQHWYPEGYGTIARNLKFQAQKTRTGVSIKFSSAGRHLPLITRLGGGMFQEGRRFHIAPTGEGENEFLSFFWKRYGRWARFSSVVHPGWRVDYLSQAFEQWGQIFQREMLMSYQRGVEEVLAAAGTPKPIGRKTRKGF